MPAQIIRGIRYAVSERFGPARLLEHAEIAASSDRGALSPQAPSGFAAVMGPQAPLRQSEDCQVLSIFTPSLAGKRPVMVFLHGGAFLSGGGELPWYDGASLAEEQDVVVVTVTYRLGVFGYLLWPGHVGPSPGMTDQIAALEWVKNHIEMYGGDPDEVTVFGQSAGGLSIAGLIEWGHGGKLFGRAIIQSGVGAGRRRPAEVHAASQAFLEFLHADPRSMPWEDLLAAQGRFIQQGRGGWMPIAPENPRTADVDLLTGWTRDDALPFVLLAQGSQLRPGLELGPLRPAIDKMNTMLAEACYQLAREAAASRYQAWVYRFDWSAPDSGLGALHGIELPFLLGSRAAWEAAPMLGRIPWEEIDRIGRSVRSHWGAFARGNSPGAGWQACSEASSPLNLLPG